jgi:hypothetical protein
VQATLMVKIEEIYKFNNLDILIKDIKYKTELNLKKRNPEK